jgi:hypothetical protein
MKVTTIWHRLTYIQSEGAKERQSFGQSVIKIIVVEASETAEKPCNVFRDKAKYVQCLFKHHAMKTNVRLSAYLTNS